MPNQIKLSTDSFQGIFAPDMDGDHKHKKSSCCLSDDVETKRAESSTTSMEPCSLYCVPFELWSSEWSSCDDSVSTMSSEESSHQSRPFSTRRTLFPNVISAMGNCPQYFSKDKEEYDSDESDDTSQDMNSSNTYERTLRHQEEVKPLPKRTVSIKHRWSFFARCMGDTTNQSSYWTSDRDMLLLLASNTTNSASPTSHQQTQSDSALVVKKMKPCLKRSKHTRGRASEMKK